MRQDGQTLNGFSRGAGARNRCYRRDSEYHLAPKRPRRGAPRGACSPATQERDKACRPTYSPMSMDTPVPAQEVEHLESGEPSGACEQSFSASTITANLFLVSAEDSAVALDTGATASFVCFRWLQRRNRVLERHGSQRVSAYPSKARLRVGDGPVGDVRRAADIPAGIAGNNGEFTALAPGADIPALWRHYGGAMRRGALRKGALEALSGNIAPCVGALWRHWAGVWNLHVIRRFCSDRGRQFLFARTGWGAIS